MNQVFWEAVVDVPEMSAEDAGAALMLAGADGVQILGADALQPTLPGSEPPRPMPQAGFATLVASYADEIQPDTVIQEAVTALADVGVDVDTKAFSFVRRTDNAWAEAWKHYFKPLQIGDRFWVVPSWEQFEPSATDVVLKLDPGMAFGTGQHATTSLCLRAIEKKLSPLSADERAAISVLDVGCGSGILAIGAAKLGCAVVHAIDNDPLAVDATHANAVDNQVDHAVTTSGDDVAALQRTYELVVANILAVTLIELADFMLLRVSPTGQLLLSGILVEQRDDVIAAYMHAASRVRRDITVEAVAQEGEWVAITLRSAA